MSQPIAREPRPSSPAVSIARELTMNIYRTDLYLTGCLECVLKTVELRLDEYNVLRIIRGGGPGGHPRAEIEKRMLHEADRLLAILHKLKSRSLVEGTLRFTITAAGQSLLASVDPAFEGAVEESVAWIPEDQIRAAIRVLESIRSGPPATVPVG